MGEPVSLSTTAGAIRPASFRHWPKSPPVMEWGFASLAANDKNTTGGNKNGDLDGS
jgi:hypothetical protein